MKTYTVYIMANKKRGTLYVGYTKNLQRRVNEHKEKKIEGFTKKYGLDKLVYYEHFRVPQAAIAREKNIKAWKREWKLRLIEEFNPEWNDLFFELL